MKLIQSLSLVLFAHLIAVAPASAADFSQDDHTAFRGDFNGDGHYDLYIKPEDKFIIIAGDIVIPLAIGPDISHTLLINNGNGTYTANYNLSESTIATLETWTNNSHNVITGDFTGDGHIDVLLQAKTLGHPSVIVQAPATNGGAPTFLETLTVDSFGFDIASDAGVTITVGDHNADGKQDLIITRVSLPIFYALAQANAQFSINPINIPAIPQAPSLASIPAADSSSDSVGTMAGNFRVDESGSASYSIPVLTVPGSGGVAPQVSLNYSSQGGNGAVGLGWSIGGLSGISRCRQTYEQDMINKAVTLTSADRFCLDGQRLMKVGSGTYGASGTEYRTEIESDARIVSHGGNTVTGPDYFVVYRKDGTATRYGDSADSLVHANGTNSSVHLTWLIRQIHDSSVNGNAIEFNYSTHATGEVLIQSIDYSQNDHQIFFNYITRTDVSKGYLVGSERQQTKLLSRVISFADSVSVRTYDLTYQNSAAHGLSQVTQIQECNGIVCYDPTVFEWADVAAGFNTTPSTTTTLDDSIGAKPGDFNGDGLQDIVWVERSVSNNGHWYAHISHGTTTGGYSEAAAKLLESEGRFLRIDSDAPDKWYVMDYNNDGYDDFLYAVDGAWYVRLSNGSLPETGTAALNIGLSSAVSNVNVADMNGDGLSDMAYVEGGALKFRFMQKVGATYSFGAAQTYTLGAGTNYGMVSNHTELNSAKLLDLNGDGNVDLVVKHNYQHVLCGSEGIVCDNNYVWQAYLVVDGSTVLQPYDSLGSSSQTDDRKFSFGDFNGDGLTDVLKQDVGSNYDCYLNNGEGFTTCPDVNLGATGHADILFGDYDLDGNIDAFYAATTGGGMSKREWNPSTNSFGPATSTGGMVGYVNGEYPAEYQRMFADVNGDGRADFVTHYVSDVNFLAKQKVYYGKDAFDASRVITKVTNGLGAETDITYNALLDGSTPSLYTKESDAGSKNWGNGSHVFDVKASMYVVSQVSSSAPTAASAAAKSSVSYSYKGGKLQAGGRGFLGFHEVSSTDNQTNIKTTTTYRQDFPFTGMPVDTIVKHGATTLSHATNTLVENTASCGAGSTTRPYVSNSVERQYDIHDASLMTTVTTSTTQDNCGNVLTMNVTTLNGSSSHAPGETYSTNTTNQYHHLTGYIDQFYGRLGDTVVSHTRNGVTQTRKSAFNYHGPTGILYQEIIEPNIPALTLTTTYVLDSYGNRVSVNTNGRTSSSIYDADGRYVEEQRDHDGNTVSKVLARNSLGQPTQIQDSSQNTMDIRYGAMGRKYFERSPNGSSSHTVFTNCGGCVGAPADAEYMTETTSAGGPIQRTYFDLVGRELRMSTQGFDGNFVLVDTEYDNLGRVSRKSDPRYDGAATYWSTFIYDVLGRLSTAIHTDGSTTQNHYNGVVDLSVTTVNGLNQQKTERKNSLGEILQVIDSLGGTVNYVYDAQGNLKQTTAPGNAVTTINYDVRGRKTSMTDPDKGTWSYTYNAFGELLTQTDAEGNTSTVGYDGHGRMISRIDSANGVVVGDASWSYGTNGNIADELGKLINENIMIGAGKSTQDITRNFSYDSLGRPSSVQTTIENEGTFDQSTTYDQYGRVFQQFDAGPFNAGQQFEYNSRGYQYRTIEAANSSQETHVYHEVLAMDARGQITSETRGGITSSRTYDAQTGRIDSIFTNAGFLQNLSYDFDVLGNLTARNDNTFTNSVSETFLYDGLNRLTQANGAASPLTINYDAAGNITSKSNMQGGATYNYGAGNAGPHAVTSVGGVTYTYDNNGNMKTGDGRSINYTTFSKPNSIQKSGHTTNFSYGPNRARFKRLDTNGSGTTTTLYVGNVERIAKPNGIVETKRYIGGTNIVTTTANNPTPIEMIVLTDHLGSTQTLVNRATGASQVLNFDAFGLRRQSTGANFSPIALINFDSSSTRRGFTGHEHMDEVGLVHMNGRVYDPLLGRFISADPVIDGVLTTQGFNRYSYVHNNPLSFTDPTGFSKWNKFRDGVLKPVAAAAASFLLPGSGFIFAANSIQAYAFAGFVAGGISSGSLQGALVGAFSGATFGGIGKHFSKIGLENLGEAALSGDFSGFHNFGGNLLSTGQVAAQISAHAIAGGIVNTLQGGKFGHGFVSAGITKSATNWQLKGGLLGGSVRAALLGGTVSTLSGGKFGNGAQTGAFQYLYNAAANSLSRAAIFHYSRNAENDAYMDDAGLYGRDDLTIDEVNGAGEFGFKQSTPAEASLHQNGAGNEHNIKFTSKVARKESWFQRNISNRYGRFELILRPNGNGTFTHVTETVNMGTLNRGNNPLSHLNRDVFPYLKFGNAPD